MNYSEIINKVSEDVGLPNEVVAKTYSAYWKYIREIVQSLPLKDDLNKDDFNKLRCNINIPSLGKLAVTWDRYVAIKNRFNYIRHIKEKNVKDKENQAYV